MGRSVTIQAPLIEARLAPTNRPEPTPSQALGSMLRHLKGVLASAEELQRVLEKQEQKTEE